MVNLILQTKQRQIRQTSVATHQVKNSLDWWKNGIPFSQTSLLLLLITDASLIGWDAHLNVLKTQSKWTPMDMSLHIILLELGVVRNACTHFVPLIKGIHTQGRS